MSDYLDKEKRAYALLQWGSPAPLAEFDEALAAEGFYSRIQKQRSDAALDAWEKANPYETNSELAAFRELESIGALTQDDFYSPAKANRGPDGNSNSPVPQTSYTDDLKQRKRIQPDEVQRTGKQGLSATIQQGQDSPESTCGFGRRKSSRRRLDLLNEESRRPASS